MRERWQDSFCLPNYTPHNWFECDVFVLTKAGYFTEFEIKLTLSDFKADANKLKNKWECVDGHWQFVEGLTKHQRVEQADPKGPSRFYYATPKGLIPDGLLPKWAGLIEFETMPKSKRLDMMVTVDAPKIHNEKINPNVKEHALKMCYYRFHRMLSICESKIEITDMEKIIVDGNEFLNNP